MEDGIDLQVRALSGLNFFMGVWLIMSPYLLGYTSGSAQWNQTLFGLVIVACSAVQYLIPDMEWASWFNGLSGLWLIVAPFVLAYSLGVAYWNQVITGIFVAVLAFWNMGAYGEHYNRPI